MKRLLSLLLVMLLLATTVLPLTAFAETKTDSPYVTNGLVSWYSGTQNTRNGLNTDADTWEDLVGNNDMTVEKNDRNYFTKTGYHLDTARNLFPQGIVDVINGQEFTVEVLFDEFQAKGKNFNTFLNCDNDNFSLFRRVSNDVLEFKFAGRPANERPMVSGGLEKLQNALITVTYRVGGSVRIYINGVLSAEATCNYAMGADNFFFGHPDASRNFETIFRSMRFYNRELSEKEVLSNALTDRVYCPYIKEGLVSWYDGASQPEDATVWKDLAGANDIPVQKDENNHFNGTGYALDSAKNMFPQAIVDTVNGQEFTIEFLGSDLVSKGSAYNTFLNCSNDHFSLFRRNDSDVLEFKFANRPASERPTVSGCLAMMKDALITITYCVGGNVCIYVDGSLRAEVPCNESMTADDFFFGHADQTRNFSAVYESMRFYNRALSAKEVAANALADGHLKDAPRHASYATIAQPLTNVIGDIGLIAPVSSKSELTNLKNRNVMPAALLLHINDNGDIADAKGNRLVSIDEAVTLLDAKVMPVFAISTEKAADALIEAIKAADWNDSFVLSSDAALILRVRTACPAVRGILDKSAEKVGNDPVALLNIRREARKNLAAIVMLSANTTGSSDVSYLQSRQISVWLKTEGTLSQTDAYRAVLSGATGIVGTDIDLLYTTAKEGLAEKTLTFAPLNIGHRGLPSKAPENTLESAILAVEQGANVIECDIYLTTDNQIVIMHDGNTSRTCNGSLEIEKSTLAQLKELYVNKGYERNKKYKECRIPTLEEFFKEFKGKDVLLFVEIKTQNTAIVPIFKELVETYDMYGQVNVITFHASQVEAMTRDYPEMTVGYLCASMATDRQADTSMKNVFASPIGKYGTTLNPSASNGAAVMRAAKLRGLSIWPWTFGDQAGYDNYFLNGYPGLTGNNCDLLGEAVRTLTMDNPGDAKVGKTEDLHLYALNYLNERTDIAGSATFRILEGADLVTIENGKITFRGEGTVTLLAGYTAKTGKKGTEYAIYAQPVTFTVAKSEEIVTTNETTGDTTGSDPTETTAATGAATTAQPEFTTDQGGNKGCGSVLSSALCLGIPVLAAAAVFGKNRKEDEE